MMPHPSAPLSAGRLDRWSWPSSVPSFRLSVATSKTMSEITPEIVQSHQLTLDEYQRIVAILGREPNLTTRHLQRDVERAL